MTNKILIAAAVAALVLVVGVGSFFAGSAYGQEQAQNIRLEFFRDRLAPAAAQGDPTQGQSGQRGQAGRVAAAGTVKSVQGNKIEVSTRNGVVTVTVDSQTQIIKTIAATIADIQPNQNITVMSDQTGNTVTARLITIRQIDQ